MKTTLQTALHWHSIGIAVAACYPGTKHLIRGTRLADPPKTARELVQMFHSGRSNIAVVTGQADSGLWLVVLDFDSIPAWWTWYTMSRIETYTVETRRGKHCYFWLEQPPAAIPVMENVEIKWGGQAVMCPPSTVEGFVYKGNEMGIKRARGIEDVLPASPEKRNVKKKVSPISPITVTINGDNNTVTIGAGAAAGDREAGAAGGGFFLYDETPRSGDCRNYIREARRIDLLSYLSPQNPARSGNGWAMALCPAHDDHHPSLRINVRLALVRCFRPDCVLGRRWLDIIGLHATLHNVTNFEAAELLMRQRR